MNQKLYEMIIKIKVLLKVVKKSLLEVQKVKFLKVNIKWKIKELTNKNKLFQKRILIKLKK